MIFGTKFYYCFFAKQQKFLFKARSTSKTPMMVNAIFDQPTCSQANKITRAARRNLQRQKAILTSLCFSDHQQFRILNQNVKKKLRIFLTGNQTYYG
jgi:hypothetical protein